jgi:hypothetical protein
LAVFGNKVAPAELMIDPGAVLDEKPADDDGWREFLADFRTKLMPKTPPAAAGDAPAPDVSTPAPKL